MAAVEEALYARLQAVSAVTDLVSTRVYPVKHDTGSMLAYPFITYEILAHGRISAMTDDTGDVESTVRFHCWGKDSGSIGGYKSARDVAAAVRGALQRWDGTSGGVVVKHVFVDGEYDIGDPTPGVYHRAIDVDVRWVE